jgi:hypothetical protein
MSLARRHRERTMAAKRSAAAVAGDLAAMEDAATPYERLRARLGLCLDELRGIQSIEAKIERKRTMLPEFDAWVEGVLDAAKEDDFQPIQDDIVTQVLVWLLDVGDYTRALPLGAHVLRYGLALPERFKRTAATMVAEEIADAALKAAGQDETFELEVLQAADELTANEDMPDEVRAKLKKAIGLELARYADALPEQAADGAAGGKRGAVEAALESLKRALALNPKVGVKKEIERLERDARRLAGSKK